MRLVIDEERRALAKQAASERVGHSYVVDKLRPNELRWLIAATVDAALDVIERELS